MLTMKTPQRRQWRFSGIFIVNFEHIFNFLFYFYYWIWLGKCLLSWGLHKSLIHRLSNEFSHESPFGKIFDFLKIGKIREIRRSVESLSNSQLIQKEQMRQSIQEWT